MNQNPLVTVGVVTYNSGEFIESTLDSIKNQDYENIELVISDDCSTDDTVVKCQTWIEKNGSRFVRAKLVTTDKNTGVTGNSNRLLNEVQGEWFKCFDGDDLMMPYAISCYVRYAVEHPEACQIVAQTEHFNEKSELGKRSNLVTKYVCRPSASAKFQLSVITKTLFFECPSHFAKTSIIREVGAFDERFPTQEDYPLMVRLIAAGYKVYFIEETTVRYRERSNSISHTTKDNSFFPNNTIRIARDYKMKYRTEYSSSFWNTMNSISIGMCMLIVNCGNDRNSLLCKFLFNIYRFTDPFITYARLLKVKAYLYNWIK